MGLLRLLLGLLKWTAEATTGATEDRTTEAATGSTEVTGEATTGATEVSIDIANVTPEKTDVQKPTESDIEDATLTTSAETEAPTSGSIQVTPVIPQINPVVIQPVCDDLVHIKNVENRLHCDGEEMVVTSQTGPKRRKQESSGASHAKAPPKSKSTLAVIKSTVLCWDVSKHK